MQTVLIVIGITRGIAVGIHNRLQLVILKIGPLCLDRLTVFEMLDGFLPGNNGTWNVSYQQTIARHLQLNLWYNGRKSPGTDIVHVGSVQLRAYF